MSKFHIIGISHDGKLDTLLDGDDLDKALDESVEFVDMYRQIFVVGVSCNAREVFYKPPVGGGWRHGAYSPRVNDLELDAPL